MQATESLDVIISIWPDMLLKERIGKCVDWQMIDKRDYLNAMKLSPIDSTKIKN